MNPEHEVQLIAYHIWEEKGRPHGCDLEHWLKAEAVWQEKHGRDKPYVRQRAAPRKAARGSQGKDAGTQLRTSAK
jgi:hypothetical protein